MDEELSYDDIQIKLDVLYIIQDELNNKMLNLITELTSNIDICLICSTQIDKEYLFECCKNKVCITCFYNIIKINIEDIQFKPIKCPFCIKILKYNEIYKICRKNKNTKLSNRYKNALNQLVYYSRSDDIFKLNKVLKNNKVYGYCSKCPFEKSRIIKINRECATAEGNIVVLKPEMFFWKKQS